MATPGLGVLRVPLINAQTADTTVSTPVYCLGYKEIAIYVTGTGTSISAGVITIETADYDLERTGAVVYSGTWSSVATVNATDVSGGKQKHVPLTTGAYSWVRTRISTTVTGTGSPAVSTTLVAV